VIHDGQHKRRLIVHGHFTEVLLDSVYSDIVFLCGIHLLVFLAELNDLNIWVTDIGNAYLEAKSRKGLHQLQALNLVIWKDTTSSSSRHSDPMGVEWLSYMCS